MSTQEISLNEQIDGALGGLPVAEQTQDYMIVFKEVGGTGPEIIGETAYFITYLVDSKGNVSKPFDDSISRLNLLQNFPIGSPALIRPDNATVLNSALAGELTVTAIGTQQPILYTQTGIPSSSYDTGSLLFLNPDKIPVDAYDPVPSIEGNMSKTTNTDINFGASIITNYTITTQPQGEGANFDAPSGKYHITASSTEDITFINIKGIATVSNLDDKNSSTVTLYLIRSGSNGESNVETTSLFIPQNGSGILEIDEPEYIGDISGDVSYYLKIGKNNNTNLTATSTQFQVYNQSPQGSLIQTGDLWVTGSGDNTWLTGSSYLTANYGNTQITTNFQTDLEFNLSPIQVPFEPRPGDRIRFEYNRNQDYTIYEVIPLDIDGYLKIRLNQKPPNGVILNNFILHRVNDKKPSYIILDVDKDEAAGNLQGFTGVIVPKYPTQELKDNLDSLIYDLKDKGIIEN